MLILLRKKLLSLFNAVQAETLKWQKLKQMFNYTHETNVVSHLSLSIAGFECITYCIVLHGTLIRKNIK